MVRSKVAETERPQTPQGKPEPEPQAEEPQPEPFQLGDSPSKMDAVREALRQGFEGVSEGVAFIKTTYGFDMSNAMFSTYKANIKKKESRPAFNFNGNGGDGDLLDALGAVKVLVC